MSHHPNKKEPAKGVDPQAKDAETARAQDAQSPAAVEKDKEQAAEAEKDVSLETINSLRAELDQAKERVLRCQAELDNYRKRAAREMDEHHRYANIGLIRELLPVLDNVQRAIEAAEKSADGSGLLDGVKLVAQQLQGVLGRHHCVKIEALGAPFDPHLHHAILQQPSDEYPANTVIMVTQEGYQLHDRVVRPSQVIVSANDTRKSNDTSVY
ncbi:MAG: nucleotide exchange factor GrpE [Thermoguttaceae bacterium]|jgi:molecular chaperone GrpE